MAKKFSFDVEPMGTSTKKRKGSHCSFKGKGPDLLPTKPMLIIARKWWKKMGSPKNFSVTLTWEED